MRYWLDTCAVKYLVNNEKNNLNKYERTSVSLITIGEIIKFKDISNIDENKYKERRNQLKFIKDNDIYINDDHWKSFIEKAFGFSKNKILTPFDLNDHRYIMDIHETILNNVSYDDFLKKYNEGSEFAKFTNEKLGSSQPSELLFDFENKLHFFNYYMQDSYLLRLFDKYQNRFSDKYEDKFDKYYCKGQNTKNKIIIELKKLVKNGEEEKVEKLYRELEESLIDKKKEMKKIVTELKKLIKDGEEKKADKLLIRREKLLIDGGKLFREREKETKKFVRDNFLKEIIDERIKYERQYNCGILPKKIEKELFLEHKKCDISIDLFIKCTAKYLIDRIYGKKAKENDCVDLLHLLYVNIEDGDIFITEDDRDSEGNKGGGLITLIKSVSKKNIMHVKEYSKYAVKKNYNG